MPTTQPTPLRRKERRERKTRRARNRTLMNALVCDHDVETKRTSGASE